MRSLTVNSAVEFRASCEAKIGRGGDFFYQYPSGFPYCPYHEDFQIGATKCWTPVDCLHCQDQLQGAQYSIFNIQYSINQCQCNCQHQDLVLFSPWWSWASFLPLPLSFYHFIILSTSSSPPPSLPLSPGSWTPVLIGVHGHAGLWQSCLLH